MRSTKQIKKNKKNIARRFTCSPPAMELFGRSVVNRPK